MLDHYEKHWIGNPKYMYDNNFIKQLRDELKTFMLAGHETSAAMMTWAIYELVHHQDLMDMVSCYLLILFQVFIYEHLPYFNFSTSTAT